MQCDRRYLRQVRLRYLQIDDDGSFPSIRFLEKHEEVGLCRFGQIGNCATQFRIGAINDELSRRTYTAFRRPGQHRPLREQDRHDQGQNRVAVHVFRKVNDTWHGPTSASRKWSKFFLLRSVKNIETFASLRCLIYRNPKYL